LIEPVKYERMVVVATEPMKLNNFYESIFYESIFCESIFYESIF